jgi:cyclophilin family peptidyl-prolyl cis-trans isomerase
VGTTKRERQKANRQQRLEELAKNARKNKTKRTVTLVSVVVIGGLLLLFGLSYLFGGDDDDTPVADTAPTLAPVTTEDPGPTTTADPNATTTTEGPTTTVAVAFEYGTAPCPEPDGSSEVPETFEGPPMKCIDEEKGYVAAVATNKGELEITLDAAKAPGNVNNFVTLARYGYYDGTDCHRIIKDFVVQCGRKNGDESAPGYTIADELPGPDPYSEGVVAMANTGSPNSGGAQFFVITGDSGAGLPASYTVLGRVTKGYDSTVRVLENLADPLANNGVPPLIPVEIESVSITELDSPPETTAPTTTTTTTTTAPATGDSTSVTDTADIPVSPPAGTESATSTTD